MILPQGDDANLRNPHLHHVGDVVIVVAVIRTTLAGLSTRGVSFVDRVSFETMRHLALDAGFAYDDDFKVEGFEVVPATASSD